MNHTYIFIKTISTTLTIIMKNMVINAFIRKYNGIVSVTVEPFFLSSLSLYGNVQRHPLENLSTLTPRYTFRDTCPVVIKQLDKNSASRQGKPPCHLFFFTNKSFTLCCHNSKFPVPSNFITLYLAREAFTAIVSTNNSNNSTCWELLRL